MIFQINKMHNGSQKIFQLHLARTYLTPEQTGELYHVECLRSVARLIFSYGLIASLGENSHLSIIYKLCNKMLLFLNYLAKCFCFLNSILTKSGFV